MSCPIKSNLEYHKLDCLSIVTIEGGEKKLTLKDLRKDIGSTQENVAWKCKVHREAVSMWERGFRKPGKKHIKTMARFFMVPIETVEAALAESQAPHRGRFK